MFRIFRAILFMALAAVPVFSNTAVAQGKHDWHGKIDFGDLAEPGKTTDFDFSISGSTISGRFVDPMGEDIIAVIGQVNVSNVTIESIIPASAGQRIIDKIVLDESDKTRASTDLNKVMHFELSGSLSGGTMSGTGIFHFFEGDQNCFIYLGGNDYLRRNLFSEGVKGILPTPECKRTKINVRWNAIGPGIKDVEINPDQEITTSTFDRYCQQAKEAGTPAEIAEIEKKLQNDNGRIADAIKNAENIVNQAHRSLLRAFDDQIETHLANLEHLQRIVPKDGATLLERQAWTSARRDENAHLERTRSFRGKVAKDAFNKGNLVLPPDDPDYRFVREALRPSFSAWVAQTNLLKTYTDHTNGLQAASDKAATCLEQRREELNPQVSEQVDPTSLKVEVVSLTGSVEIVPQDSLTGKPISAGDVIHVNDRIFTGADSTVVLRFANGFTVSLAELTDIKVAVLNGTESKVQTMLWVRAGQVTAQADKSDVRRSDFQIRTPTATAGVRGTVFTVRHIPGPEPYSTITVKEGIVAVRPANPQLKPVNLPTGSSTRVNAGSIETTGRTYAYTGPQEASNDVPLFFTEQPPALAQRDENRSGQGRRIVSLSEGGSAPLQQQPLPQGGIAIREAAPSPPPAAPASPQEQEMELAFWNAIKDSDDISLYQAYLKRFPGGTFVPIAEAKITAAGGSIPERSGAGTQLAVSPPAATAFPAPPDDVHDCDMRAGDPEDELAVSYRIDLDRILPKEAIEACERAAAEFPEELRFRYQLGRAYHAGKQYKEAAANYEYAAERGYLAAMYHIGWFYQVVGRGVKTNHRTARKWYALAAEGGHLEATFKLGLMTLRGEGTVEGKKTPGEDDEAFRLIKTAADAGNVSAMGWVGSLYVQGVGTKRSYTDAAKYYEMSARGGNRSSQFMLAVVLDRGGTDIQTQRDRAARLIYENIKAGDVKSINDFRKYAAKFSTEFMRKLQSLAQEDGYYSGPIDGNISPAFLDAVEKACPCRQ